MLQREIVRFRASDKLPNPLEVDYWVDISSNYYGGCIRYYRNDTDTWEELDLNSKQINALIDYINKNLDLMELYINDSITEIREELSDFEDAQREEVNKLWEYINLNIGDINTQILNLRNDISEIVDNDIASLQQQITNIAQDVTELNTTVNTKVTDLKEYVDELIADLKDYVDGLVTDLTGLINQETTNRANAINALRTELKNYIDGLIGDAGTNLTELEAKINNHIVDKSNPHQVTKTQVGLGNVDNTSDINKPVSTAQATAIADAKAAGTAAKEAIDNHAARRDNPHIVTRAQLSLATTDNVVFNKVSAPSGFFKE